MKLGNDQRLEKAVYLLWFKQTRMEGVPVNGPVLCKKAVELSKSLHGEGAMISTSEGWKW